MGCVKGLLAPTASRHTDIRQISLVKTQRADRHSYLDVEIRLAPSSLPLNLPPGGEVRPPVRRDAARPRGSFHRREGLERTPGSRMDRRSTGHHARNVQPMRLPGKATLRGPAHAARRPTLPLYFLVSMGRMGSRREPDEWRPGRSAGCSTERLSFDCDKSKRAVKVRPAVGGHAVRLRRRLRVNAIRGGSASRQARTH